MKIRNTGYMSLLAAGILVGATSFAGPGQGGGRRGRQRDPAKFFSKADADGSGTVTVDELRTAREKRKAAREKRGGDRKRPEGARTPPSVEDVFSKMDQNGDGSVTQDEFTSALAQRKGRRGGREAAKR